MLRINLHRISRDFAILAERFERFILQDVRLSHISQNIIASNVRAGRLLVEAIDGGAFPESHSKANGGWWDRAQGRIPGSVFALLESFQWSQGQPPPHKCPEYLEQAAGEWTVEQFTFCWTFAIGSWLQLRFPSRFRHAAAECGWKHVAVDKDGFPIDKDGQPLRGRWYKDGEAMPEDFEWKPEHRSGFAWRRDGEYTCVEESYDQADWLARQRIRAEVYADACRLLSELIESEEVLVGASGVTAVSEEKLKLMIRQQVKAEAKTSLSDDIFVAAYRQEGSMRKAASFLSRETVQEITKDKVQRAVKRAGGVQAVLNVEDSDSIQRTVASQRRDRQRKFASSSQPPDIK